MSPARILRCLWNRCAPPIAVEVEERVTAAVELYVFARELLRIALGIPEQPPSWAPRAPDPPPSPPTPEDP